MALDQKNKELKARELTLDLAKKHQRKANNAFKKLRAKNRQCGKKGKDS